MSLKSRSKGFNLIELMIAVAIIGILAAITIPLYRQHVAQANDRAAESDAKNTLTVMLVNAK